MANDVALAGLDAALPRHWLAGEHLTALLAGGGDEAAVAELLTAERSWRLLQLWAVRDELSRHPTATGPLPALAQAWELFARAEQRAPDEAAAVLLHPQVGTWAGYLLRRLRGSTTADDPLWVDVGYFHAVAAAAAIRAGLDFAIRVPVRASFLSLPTLGGAQIPEPTPHTYAEVAAASGDVTATVAGTSGPIRIVGPGGSDAWQAAPTIRTAAGGHTLDVTLDHLDPYRNLRSPTAPTNLTADQVERWRTTVERGWEIVATACPQYAGPIARGVRTLVPQPAAARFRTMSASAGDAFGSMIMSEPEDAVEFAVTLVHEFQHIKLGGLLHLAPLREGEPEQRLYAPWRDDPRPLGGLLQGIYAFVGIVEFWRAYRHHAAGRTAPLAQFEFARWRRQVAATLARVAPLPQLTSLGRDLIARLTDTAAGWPQEEVPAEPRVAAEAANDDHRARWRMHHLRPAVETVSTLTAAWRAGAERPEITYPPPLVTPDPAARRLDTRAALALWRLTDPAGFAELLREPAAVGQRVQGADEGDLAYAAGDLDRAAEWFLGGLRDEPGSISAWAGLGAVEAATGATRAAAALRQRPELVRAVHRSIVAGGGVADPRRLAEWVGPA